VYEWHDKQDSLRLIGFDGTRMRVLTTTAPRPLPVAWSPDGKQIVAILSSEDGTHQIALISALDGSTTPLKSTGWRQPSVGGFSPDSRLLVYSLPKSIPSAGDGGIFAIAVDGSREAALVQGPANDANPFWSPDGQRVVFTSDRSGTKGLWSLRVADGRPQGSPELVRANIGDATTKGFSQDGSYFYGTYNIQADVYAADIDPETLRAVSQPSRVTEKFVGSNWGPAWSPDGRSIAFFRALDSSQSRAIVIRSVSTGEERTVPVRIQQGGYFPGYFCPHWFPDGRSVLVLDTADSRWLFKRIDIETGDVKVILEGLRIHQQVRLSPDGKILYYSVRGEHMPHSEFGLLRLMKRDLETGQELELYRTESPGVGFFGLAVSSDGNHLSFLRNDVENGKRTLFTLPAKGGTPRELYKGTYDKPTPFSGAWTRDGRHVLFTSHTDARGQLWAIPAEGGEPRALDITMQQILFPALSPDGRRIAFTGTRSRGELWVIHNLLSETQASR
jgi:Tol biopolymer transport system component